ncbi:MAG TPA: CRISPR-associated endonuclease Cas2, partial [Syntrophomonadaceae bacterium]|nr:CRISPR-associated endonuclease Cas2 [Syntrophomonadaceae bacterium]
MRIIVFFDLPVTTKTQRKIAADFRKFLIQDGYYMVQFSVYARVCNGYDAIDKHIKRLKSVVPDNGSIRVLVITERQYQSMYVLTGKLV